jgi:hypothetical protein
LDAKAEEGKNMIKTSKAVKNIFLAACVMTSSRFGFAVVGMLIYQIYQSVSAHMYKIY